MTLPASYFDDLYASSGDPWGFTDRWYERRKRALTLAALPRRTYRRGFEPGCSIGVQSTELAARCEVLVSTDVSEAALESAAARRRRGVGEGGRPSRLRRPARGAGLTSSPSAAR